MTGFRTNKHISAIKNRINYAMHFILLFFYLIIASSSYAESDETSFSDSTSYSYFTNKLLETKEYKLLYSVINENYTEHWSTNLILIKELAKTDLQQKEPKIWANIKIVEGNIWSSIDDQNSAYQSYMEAAQIFNDIGYHAGQALVFLNLARIPEAGYSNINISINMIKQAAKIFETNHDSINTFKCYNNIAVQFLNRKRTDSVLYYLDLASHFMVKKHEDYFKATSLLNKGEYYRLMDSMNTSNNCYLEANRLLKGSTHLDALAYSYSQLGLNSGETEPFLAIDYYKKAIYYSDQANEKSNKLTVYENLANTYKQVSDYVNAADYYLKAIELNRYLKSTELKEKDELLKLHLDINRQSKHITALNFEKEILERNSRVILIVSIVLLVMGLIIIILLRAQITKKKILIQQTKDLSESKHLLIKSQLDNEQLQKKLIEEELKNKSNQVSSFAMQLVKKNEFMQRLQKEIVILRKKVKNDTTLNEIQRIVLEISQNIDTENNLLEFNMQVNKANQEFYSTLEQHFPKLTKTEKQILGFLKINMSSKEIASILNITLQGVNTKRYRLRKKLELDNSRSFEDFFSELKDRSNT